MSFSSGISLSGGIHSTKSPYIHTPRLLFSTRILSIKKVVAWDDVSSIFFRFSLCQKELFSFIEVYTCLIGNLASARRLLQETDLK